MKALISPGHGSIVCLTTALLTLGVALVAATSAGSQVMVAEMHEGLLHELTVSKTAYVMYEDVSIEYVVTNQSGEPVWMWFPCSGIAIRIVVRDMHDELMWVSPDGCLDAFWDDILDAGQSYERADTWDMFDYVAWWPITESGIYTVQGVLTAYNDPHAYVVSLPITIVDESTVVPETEERSWTTIKALYR